MIQIIEPSCLFSLLSTASLLFVARYMPPFPFRVERRLPLHELGWCRVLLYKIFISLGDNAHAPFT